MRIAGSFVVGWSALLVAGLVMTPAQAEAQAVAFFPTVGSIPDGVNLNATPVVSADRRYVRLSLNANFSTINGFNTFPVPAAVGGGGGGGGGLRGGLGGRGGGGGAGFGSFMGGPDGFADLGVPYRLDYQPTTRKAAKAKAVKVKKPLPDPVMIPIKKGEARANLAGAPRG